MIVINKNFVTWPLPIYVVASLVAHLPLFLFTFSLVVVVLVISQELD